MTKLKVHHQGWLALPERFQKRLGIESGGEIEAELVGDTVVLKSAKGSTTAVQEGMTAEASEAMPDATAAALEALKPEQPVAQIEAPPTPKRRGRPPKVRPVGG